MMMLMLFLSISRFALLTIDFGAVFIVQVVNLYTALNNIIIINSNSILGLNFIPKKVKLTNLLSVPPGLSLLWRCFL